MHFAISEFYDPLLMAFWKQHRLWKKSPSPHLD